MNSQFYHKRDLNCSQPSVVNRSQEIRNYSNPNIVMRGNGGVSEETP